MEEAEFPFLETNTRNHLKIYEKAECPKILFHYQGPTPVLHKNVTGSINKNEMKYEKYFDKARNLKKEDIGKKVMKVKCAITYAGIKDASYMNEIYTLKSIEFNNDEIYSFTLIDSKNYEKTVKDQCEHKYYNDWVCLDDLEIS